MALPSTWTRKGDGIATESGIGIALVPQNVTYGCEVQRTSDNGSGAAASTGATSFLELSPGDVPESGRVIRDLLPMDNNLRFYRARHVLRGYDAGSWTGWTTGHRPILLDSAPTPLSAFGSPVIATIQASTQITKYLRVPGASFQPNNPQLTAFSRSGTALTVGASTSAPYTINLFAHIFPPTGATLTNFEVRGFRTSSSMAGATTGDLFFSIGRIDSETVNTGLGTLYHTGSSWTTLSTALNQVVSSSQHYVVGMTNLLPTTDIQHALNYAEVGYTINHYRVGI